MPSEKAVYPRPPQGADIPAPFWRPAVALAVVVLRGVVLQRGVLRAFYRDAATGPAQPGLQPAPRRRVARAALP